MIYILILGASGGIARVATDLFRAKTDARLTPRRVLQHDASGIRVVEGDVLDGRSGPQGRPAAHTR